MTYLISYLLPLTTRSTCTTTSHIKTFLIGWYKFYENHSKAFVALHLNFHNISKQFSWFGLINNVKFNVDRSAGNSPKYESKWAFQLVK